MSTNYTHLDALLLEAIERKPRHFNSLQMEFSEEFDKHSKPNRWGDKIGWRVIDRRLQALRKAGHIKADRKLGWVAVKKEPS